MAAEMTGSVGVRHAETASADVKFKLGNRRCMNPCDDASARK